jgi:hypothetical protein
VATLCSWEAVAVLGGRTGGRERGQWVWECAVADTWNLVGGVLVRRNGPGMVRTPHPSQSQTPSLPQCPSGLLLASSVLPSAFSPPGIPWRRFCGPSQLRSITSFSIFSIIFHTASNILSYGLSFLISLHALGGQMCSYHMHMECSNPIQSCVFTFMQDVILESVTVRSFECIHYAFWTRKVS